MDLDRLPSRQPRTARLGCEVLEQRDTPAAFYVVPGVQGSTTALDFSWIGRDSAFFSEIGVYEVDDANGTVDGVSTFDPNYAATALANATPVFTRGQTKGARNSESFAAGTVLGFYMVQNSTLATARAFNPANLAINGPVVFFSFAGGPDLTDHAQASYQGNQAVVRFEDGLRGGDRDFNDAVIKVQPLTQNLVPGGSGQVTPTAFRLNRRDPGTGEIGVYQFDDAIGTVDGVRPGDPGYAAAVARSAKRTVLFSPLTGAGAVAGANLPASGNYGFYMIRGITAEQFLQVNPTNHTGFNLPVMFFSQSNANPDSTVHVRQSPNTLHFEDGLNGGDQDFNDAVVSFVYGTPVSLPVSPTVPPTSPPPPPPPPPPPEPGAPAVTAALTTDTGAADNVTATLGVSGTVADTDGIATLEARLGTTGAFTNITSALANGTYAISATLLQTLNGGVALPDGTYAVQVRATDTLGNTSAPTTLTFTLARSVTANLLLDATSDTGFQGDFRTETQSITLRGTTRAGSAVLLERQTAATSPTGTPVRTQIASTTADASGAYTFVLTGTGALNVGPNGYRVRVTDGAGNTANAAATITLNQAPTALNPTATPVAGTVGGNQTFDLNTFFADADTNQYARITTNLPGNPVITVQLFNGATPTHVANFLAYASANAYDSSFIHRVASSPGVVQGGGFEFRPPATVNITNATWAAGVATVTTAAPHGLKDGQTVTIAGVNTAGYNGTYTVAVVNATTFQYTLAADPGGTGNTGTSTGANFAVVGGLLDITNATWAAGVATVTTATAHNLSVGQVVSINGALSTGAGTGFNDGGTIYTVTSVINATTFTYALATDPGTYVGGGSVAAGVTNEPWLPNSEGTLALAKRGGNASSGTNQFYFNTGDNSNGGAALDDQGFTVFGQVVGNGQATLDAIAALTQKDFSAANGAFGSVPVQNGAVNSLPNATANDLVQFTDISVVTAPLTYSAVSSNTGVVSVVVTNNNMTLNFNGSGTATVTATATDPDGATVTYQFTVTVP